MATGRLGNIAVGVATNATAYTVPAGFYTVCNVTLVNRNATAVRIRVAMTTSGGATPTPNPQEWLEYDTIVVPGGVFERTGLVLNYGLNIVVYSDAANVGCTVYGIETSTV